MNVNKYSFKVNLFLDSLHLETAIAYSENRNKILSCVKDKKKQPRANDGYTITTNQA